MTVRQCEHPVVKVLFSKQPLVINDDLNDCIEYIRNNVIGSQKQSSCGAQSNANKN